LEKRRLQGNLTVLILPVLERSLQAVGGQLFTQSDNDSTRGNGFKLKEGRFRLDLRNIFFTQRVVRHWHRLPREAVDAPSPRHIQG